jgi:predicted transcriptional regulator
MAKIKSLREKIVSYARTRKTRGVTTAEIMTKFSVDRGTASSALSALTPSPLKLSSTKRVSNISGRRNSVYVY